MDRPAPINDVYDVAHCGMLMFEAEDPEDLALQMQTAFATAAAAAPDFPWIQSWDLSGGGGGANWRAQVEICTNRGWGLNTAIPAGFARVAFGVAQNSPECVIVANNLMQAIQAAEPDTLIWGWKSAGGGRDGAYLVGVMYCNGSGGRPTYYEAALAPQGPFVASTGILLFNLPQTLGGLPATERTWMVQYSIEIEDTTGANGVSAELTLDGGQLKAINFAAPAGEWHTFSGHVLHPQSIAGASQYQINVAPVGANVSCRGAVLSAVMINNQVADS
jgi:hypothetical protein